MQKPSTSVPQASAARRGLKEGPRALRPLPDRRKEERRLIAASLPRAEFEDEEGQSRSASGRAAPRSYHLRDR